MTREILIAVILAAVVLVSGVVYVVSRPDDSITLITSAMAEHRRLQVIRAAEAGNAWAMNALYLIGESSTGKKDKKRALELMIKSESPTARYYHFRWTHKKKEYDSPEGVLARARFMEENLKMPFQTDDEFVEQSQTFSNSLDSLRSAASAGDIDAMWVISRLDTSAIRLLQLQ